MLKPNEEVAEVYPLKAEESRTVGHDFNHPRDKKGEAFNRIDSFEFLDSRKPRLFESKGTVLRKNGFFKNLIMTGFIFAVLISGLFIPLENQIVDRHAVVSSERKAIIKSPQDGFVSDFRLTQGAPIKKGQTLFRITSLESEFVLRTLEDEQMILEKQLDREKTEYELLLLEALEAKRLKALGSVQENTFKAARLRLELKRQDMGIIEEKISRNKEQILFQKQIITESELKSPLKGLILNIAEDKKGTFVTKGEPLAILAESPSLIEAYLDEKYAALIYPGINAEIKFHAMPFYAFKGNVLRIAPLASSESGKRFLKVWIKCESIPPVLRHGMSARISIRTEPQSLFEKLSRHYSHLFNGTAR